MCVLARCGNGNGLSPVQHTATPTKKHPTRQESDGHLDPPTRPSISRKPEGAVDNVRNRCRLWFAATATAICSSHGHHHTCVCATHRNSHGHNHTHSAPEVPLCTCTRIPNMHSSTRTSTHTPTLHDYLDLHALPFANAYVYPHCTLCNSDADALKAVLSSVRRAVWPKPSATATRRLVNHKPYHCSLFF